MKTIEDFKIYLTSSDENKPVIYCSIKFKDDQHSYFHTAECTDNFLSDLVGVQAWVYDLATKVTNENAPRIRA